MSSAELAGEIFLWAVVLGFSSVMLLLTAWLAATICKDILK